MAQQYTYTTQPVTLATRAAAYDRLALFLQHCDAYNINLISIVRNADNSVTITGTPPIGQAADVAMFGFS